MKLHLTNVTRYDKDKEGNPLKTKDGRPYTRLVIKTDEYQAKSISGFDSQETRDWKVGDEVEAEVEQKGEYLNFKLPKKGELSQQTLEQILKTVTNLRLDVSEILNRIPRDLKKEYPGLPEEETKVLNEEPPF